MLVATPLRTAVTVSAPIRVSVDVSVYINIHVAAAPIAVIGKNRAPGHPNAECDQGRNRIIHVGRSRIIDRRWIARHIDHLRVGRLHLNDLLSHGVDLVGHISLIHHNVRYGDDLLR